MIDGASFFRILLQIIIPLSVPIMATICAVGGGAALELLVRRADLHSRRDQGRVLQLVLRRVIIDQDDSAFLGESNDSVAGAESVVPESIKAATVLISIGPDSARVPVRATLFRARHHDRLTEGMTPPVLRGQGGAAARTRHRSTRRYDVTRFTVLAFIVLIAAAPAGFAAGTGRHRSRGRRAGRDRLGGPAPEDAGRRALPAARQSDHPRVQPGVEHRPAPGQGRLRPAPRR